GDESAESRAGIIAAKCRGTCSERIFTERQESICRSSNCIRSGDSRRWRIGQCVARAWAGANSFVADFVLNQRVGLAPPGNGGSASRGNSRTATVGSAQLPRQGLQRQL